MNVYSIDVRIVATAYIKAESEAEALEIIRGVKDTGLEFSSRHQSIDDDICVDGGDYRSLYDNDESIALSPAMTLVEPIGEDLDLSEEDIDVEGDDD
jgi:hypothetical protein